MIGEVLSLLMFFGVIGFLLLGFPVAFTLAGSALFFAGVGWLLGAFDWSNLSSLTPRYLGIMLNDTLVAVPLFIFMGMMLERSGIAEQLLITMGRLFGSLRGGLGLSVVVVAPFSPPRPAWSARRWSRWAACRCPRCCAPATIRSSRAG